MKAEADLPILGSVPSSKHQSLVRASLDIGRVLAQRNAVTFISQGTCMYPTIRPGDVLIIKPCQTAEIAVGDIAVCRTPNTLFGHRVIGKGVDGERLYIITRPDRSSHGSDVPTFDENLLGVVSTVKRKGKSMPLAPKNYSMLFRYYYKKRLDLIEKKELFKFRLTKLYICLEKNLFYHFMVQMSFMVFRPQLTYFVQVPLNETFGDAVFHCFEPETFNPEKTVNGRRIKSWTIALYLNKSRKPVAWINFSRDKNDVWVVADSHLRLRYKGSGLEKALREKADKILASGSNSFDIN